MKFDEGDHLLVLLIENRELVGKWGVQDHNDSDFIKLYDVCHSLNDMVPDGQGGVAHRKILVPAEEGGNFQKEVLIRCDKIVFIKKMELKSDAYRVYTERTTGIKPPTPLETSAITNDKRPMGPMAPVRRIR